LRSSMEKAVIISAGNDWVTGRAVDTIAPAIATELVSLGIQVTAVLKVGQEKDRLLWALERGAELGDLIIGVGGLGPLADNLPSEAAAAFLGRELAWHVDVAEDLQRRFVALGIPWTAHGLKQAQFPEGAQLIVHPRGGTPGFRVDIGQGRWLIWLSGAHGETEVMMRESVVPWLVQGRKIAKFAAASFKLYGLTESELDDILKPVQLPKGGRISVQVHDFEFTLRLSLQGTGKDTKSFQQFKNRIEGLLQPYIYGPGGETLEEIVGGLLREKGWSLALAESCTGGAISHRISRVPGSSSYFLTSAVTYSDAAKQRLLGVHRSTLKRHGAASKETAIEMARGIRKRVEATIALSATGVAGPTGGSEAAPVGTVWMAVVGPRGSDARRLHFDGERERVIGGAAQAALNWLREVLLHPVE